MRGMLLQSCDVTGGGQKSFQSSGMLLTGNHCSAFSFVLVSRPVYWFGDNWNGP